MVLIIVMKRHNVSTRRDRIDVNATEATMAMVHLVQVLIKFSKFDQFVGK